MEVFNRGLQGISLEEDFCLNLAAANTYDAFDANVKINHIAPTFILIAHEIADNKFANTRLKCANDY